MLSPSLPLGVHLAYGGTDCSSILKLTLGPQTFTSFSILVPLHSFCLKLLSAPHPTFSGALGPPSSGCHTLALHPTPLAFFLFRKPPLLATSSVHTHSRHPGLPP